MRVVIMGPGRLGGSLVVLLRAAGVPVWAWSRGQPVPEDADVYWVTVADAAVGEVAALLPADAVALHAAGAHGPELLGPRPERGVLHPLMTFPGADVGLPDLHGVGARVDGTPRAASAARALAERLGMRAFVFAGDPLRYHAAASLASGHLGALFLEAAGVLAAEGLDADEARALLFPLAAESLRRAAAFGPSALTGAAARGDRATVAAHQSAIGPERGEIYRLLAERIKGLRTDG